MRVKYLMYRPDGDGWRMFQVIQSSDTDALATWQMTHNDVTDARCFDVTGTEAAGKYSTEVTWEEASACPEIP